MKKSPSFKLLQTASYHLSPANFYVLLIQNTTQHGPPTVPLNVNIILQIVASTVNKYRCQWDIVINFIPLLLVNYLLSCKIGIMCDIVVKVLGDLLWDDNICSNQYAAVLDE